MSTRVRGLFSMLVLVVLTGGIPFALVRFVGRPWPRPFPRPEVVWESIRAGNISDATLVKGLAIFVWVAWARLVVSIAVEVVAQRAGRSAPRVPGLGSFQQWAAAMVASVTLLVGVGVKPSAASATRPVVASAVASTHDGASPARDPDRGRVMLPAAAPSNGSRDDQVADQVIHLVRRNESFWSIAELRVGDGTRWREIVELNRGREVAPGVIFDGSPAHLMPGWALVVPSIEPVALETVRVQRGDTLSSIAGDVLGDAGAWPELWEANRGHEFAGRVFTDPNLIMPGWELIVPLAPSPAPAPSPPSPPVETSIASPVPQPPPAAGPRAPTLPPPSSPARSLLPPTSSPAVTVTTTPTRGQLPWAPPTVPNSTPTATAQHAANGDSATERTAAGLVGLGAAAMLASGVLGAVAARRRRRLRGASPSARLESPSSRAVRTETVLRGIVADERIARLDIALRAAATGLVASTSGIGILGAIVDGAGGVDILTTSPAPSMPAPWTAVTPHRWRLCADVGLAAVADAARRAHQPCPAIAHIGTIMLDDGNRGDLYVDLEAIGLLTVQSVSQRNASAVVRAIAGAVAVSPMSELARIITCGLDETHLGHPSMFAARSLDHALDLAATSIGTTASLTSAALSTFALRAQHNAGEAWEPAIVFVRSLDPSNESATAADDDRDADRDVLELTTPGGRGLAVVLDRALEGARWTIEQRVSTWFLRPLDLEFCPVGLEAADLDDVRVVLDEAARPLDTSKDAGVPDTHFDEPAWPLMVRMLGPVDVIDRTHRRVEFERAKALELVVWLTQHRQHSTRTAARTALWESSVRDATFANVVSDARRSLARLVRGDQEWIARTLTEQLPLHASIVTDADLLRDRLAVAKAQSADDAIATLRPGLALVRDAPFSGTGYLWPDGEGITSHLTLLVTSAATVLATHYLALGDIGGVFWSTEQGLKVLPGHEELIALRMRAHARDGDLAGIRQVWESYERVVTSDMWSDGEMSPKLVALRRELLASSLMNA